MQSFVELQVVARREARPVDGKLDHLITQGEEEDDTKHDFSFFLVWIGFWLFHHLFQNMTQSRAVVRGDIFIS
jgi:hypothetical protein